MKTQEKKQKVQRTAKKVPDSLSYTVEVRDKDGRVLQRISAPSRSYVQQWNQVICAQAKTTEQYDHTITVKDTAGNNQECFSYIGVNFRANAAIGVVIYGIRVGKGTTAVVITDYALGSPCDEGTDTDEFEHQAVEFTAPSVAGSTCSFTITRTMINNSGATITGVKEIGCYTSFKVAPTIAYALSFRDILPSALSIPDGGSITVTYTIAVTV